MANFFSADYWKAFYFKAMGGQETAVDPNAMSGSFAGSSSWTGTLDLPAGSISGAFAGASAFTADLTFTGTADEPTQQLDGHDGWPRRKAPIVEDMAELRRRWAEEDANRQEARRRQDADKAARRRAIARALGTEPEAVEPETPQLTIEDRQARLKALTALLDYPKPVLTIAKPSLIDFKARRERKEAIEADRKAREEVRALAERIRQEIRDYDDALILLLLAA
jgi:hypothetical protein